MSKQEPQLGMDRWVTPAPDPAGELLAPDPWQDRGDGDFATGTSPGELVDDERGPVERMRTRITYLGEGSSIDEESFYRPEPASTCDEGGYDLLSTSRLPSLADRTPLWSVMSPRVVCVRADLGTDSLTAMLFALDLRSVPVVDDDGCPVGVVSRSDLLRHRREGDHESPLRLAGPYGGHGEYLGPGFHADVSAELVADVMMSMAFSLPETATLSRAAAIMAYEGVHRIPVVASDGKVVGLISSLDVMRWLAQHDGYAVPGNPLAYG
jgi:CBS domain-containing protein